ncbi:putative tail fiber protein [Pseudomonas phage Motto]|nr:putative tail fiber protein [Pseudomonas phage Motto]
MALYRTGTASMDAQGVITGVGTKWREPLSLIRTGATIVFLTDPLNLAVISDIVSDTEMKAIQTNDAVIPEGTNYVILLNDSLTVDGMAQDVAETLRYYQSKETEIADALEFFRDFDLQGLKDLVARIEQAAKDVDQAKLDAQAAQAGAEAAQQATNQIKTETQQIKDSAVTDTEAIKQEAFNARDEAEAAQFAAEEAKAGADTAKAGAETARDQAEEWAKQVNPENLLHKDQNLADVPDKEAARNALEVAAAIDTFLKADNLAGIADRAAAWLNVRPIGATPLSSDPVDDLDATTKRWVTNLVQGGVVGATMNGVQNWGVGEKTLWDSRAFIPQWAVPADGQLLNRTDWPELWNHAQMHSPIDDAEWLSTPSKRGMWSNGDGETTFRAPDLNGVQDGSIRGLYGRGDGSGFYVPGFVFENASPDITGRLGAVDANGRAIVSSGIGAFSVSQSELQKGFVTSSETSTNNRYTYAYFKASDSNDVYGRANTSEVRPNTFAGVWIIRASGGFVAANTKWSVINEDENKPEAGTVAFGGEVVSLYRAAGANNASASLMARKYNNVAAARLAAYNDDTSKGVAWLFDENGMMTLPATAGGNSTSITVSNADKGMFIDAYTTARSFFARAGGAVGVQAGEQNEIRIDNYGTSATAGTYINSIYGRWYNGLWQLGGVRSSSTLLSKVQLNITDGGGTNASFMFYPNGVGQAAQWQNTSDRRIKSLWETIPNPLEVMESMRGYSWYYEPFGTQGFGFMADEVEKFFPGAVSETEGNDVEMPDGSTVEKVKSVDTYGVAAALHHEAILALMNEVKELRKEIAELKANK